MREKTPHPGASAEARVAGDREVPSRAFDIQDSPAPARSQVLLRADGQVLRAPFPFDYTAEGSLIYPVKRGPFNVILDSPFYIDHIEQDECGNTHGLVCLHWRPHSGWETIEMPSHWVFRWGRWVQRGVWPANMRLFKEFIFRSTSEILRENSYARRGIVSRRTDGDG